jgi:hypothetical protein
MKLRHVFVFALVIVAVVGCVHAYPGTVLYHPLAIHPPYHSLCVYL